MKRLPSYRSFHLPLLLTLLSSCTEVSPELVWRAPGEGDSVAGTVELQVEATGETPPANVVFTVDNQPVAKVYAEAGMYRAFWDSAEAQPGAVTLIAKPYGGTPIRREIIVTNSGNE